MASISTSAASMSPAREAGSGMAKMLSHVCFFGGFASIAVSILVWLYYKSPEAGHGERFAIFVGLWAPTFFALSDRLDRYGRMTHTR